MTYSPLFPVTPEETIARGVKSGVLSAYHSLTSPPSQVFYKGVVAQVKDRVVAVPKPSRATSNLELTLAEEPDYKTTFRNVYYVQKWRQTMKRNLATGEVLVDGLPVLEDVFELKSQLDFWRAKEEGVVFPDHLKPLT